MSAICLDEFARFICGRKTMNDMMRLMSRILVSVVLPVFTVTVYGSDERSEAPFLIRQSTVPGAEWQLEAKQADLHAVIGALAEHSRIKIHYASLPVTPVTATCVGQGAVTLLQCLLGSDINMLYRYPETDETVAGKETRVPQEIWILASSLNPKPVLSSQGSNCSELEERKHVVSNGWSQDEQQNRTGTRDLIERTESGRAEQRAQALAAIARLGKSAKPELVDAAIKGLTDRDAFVREQALHALSQTESDPAVLGVYVQQALQDPEAGIRLMALDAAGDDVTLLQQALQDSDVTVRELAGMKLESLLKY